MSMSAILSDLKLAELQTVDTIKIIQELRNAVCSTDEDEAMSDKEFEEYHKETNTLQNIAKEVDKDLIRFVPTMFHKKVTDEGFKPPPPSLHSFKINEKNKKNEPLYKPPPKIEKHVSIASSTSVPPKPQKKQPEDILPKVLIYTPVETNTPKLIVCENKKVKSNKPIIHTIAPPSTNNHFIQNIHQSQPHFMTKPSFQNNFIQNKGDQITSLRTPYSNFEELKERRREELRRKVASLERELKVLAQRNVDLRVKLVEAEKYQKVNDPIDHFMIYEQKSSRCSIEQRFNYNEEKIIIPKKESQAKISSSNSLYDAIKRAISQGKESRYKNNTERQLVPFTVKPRKTHKKIKILEDTIMRMQEKLDAAQSENRELNFKNKAVYLAAQQISNGKNAVKPYLTFNRYLLNTPRINN